MMMKVKVTSKKAVKPSKSTPPELRTYKISLIDELNPSMQVIRILYYPSESVGGKKICLEESLAQVLPLFYPLAGRYNTEKHEVDCNDEGAEYYVAEVDGELEHLLGPDVETELLNHLLPVGIGEADEPTDPMLAVQINRFRCGGLAIGVCTSHRIFDSCSQAIFLKAWANAATDGGLVINPDFDSPLYFPPENISSLQFGLSRARNTSVVTRRFTFDGKLISELRRQLSPEWRGERPPSRVVLVSSILTQAFLRADRARHGRSRASIVGQAIDVRGRTVPPISKHACGTWASMSFLRLTEQESRSLESDFPGTVARMRETTRRGVEDCARILSDRKFGRRVLIDSEYEAAGKTGDPNTKVIWISDWSRFGDYELDFGFGKPAWASLADVPVEDFIMLMNTKENDGTEAWVFLHESDVAYLDQDDGLRILLTGN